MSQFSTPIAPKRNAGRTRILISTPEENLLESRLKSTTKSVRKQPRRLIEEKENTVVESEEENFDLDIDLLHRPTLPSPKRTRIGRVMKQTVRTDL